MKFITEKPPPKGRENKCVGPLEQHLYEAAVMLAVARWMFKLGAKNVCVCPDGMHAKQFDICSWLKNEGFQKLAERGKTREAGTYSCGPHTLDVEFAPGRGDVIAELRGRRVLVEAKGGIVNTRHSGQKSKLRKHLYEAVGMLLDRPNDAGRLIAAVPLHPETEKLARRMAVRCRDAGIEIALVSGTGEVRLWAEEAKG